jgi:hypothetical protein
MREITVKSFRKNPKKKKEIQNKSINARFRNLIYCEPEKK